MRKYIGTSTISKNTKKRNRSRLRNEPITPASSSSSHAKYGLSRVGSSLCGSIPTMASGNSRPVSTTRNSEMPSTPRCHEIPHASIHGCFDTNWKPPSLPSKACSTQIDSAPVNTDDNSAVNFMYSGRRRDSTAMISAPAAGTNTSIDRIGKVSEEPPVAARIVDITAPPAGSRTTRGSARPRRRRCRRSCARCRSGGCGPVRTRRAPSSRHR